MGIVHELNEVHMKNDERKALPINHLRIENFRCLKDVSLDLEPLTVLVGPNGSGKTSILRGLECLGVVVPNYPQPHPVFGQSNNGNIISSTFRGRGGMVRMFLRGQLDGTEFEYGIGFPPERVWAVDERLETSRLLFERQQDKSGTVTSTSSGKRQSWDNNASILNNQTRFNLRFNAHANTPAELVASLPFLDSMAGLFEGMTDYRLQPSSLLTEHSHNEQHPWNPGRSMTDAGIGLSEELAGLLLTGRGRLDRIEQHLRDWFPDFLRLQVSGQQINIERRDHSIVEQRGISDGFLMMLGYLVLALGRPGQRLLLLEEPENGVHPGLIQRVIRFLKSLANDPEDPTQILMTTHSPLVLNEIEPEAIRLVERSEETGETSVRPFTSVPDLERLLEFQWPGEVWVNLRVDQPPAKEG